MSRGGESFRSLSGAGAAAVAVASTLLLLLLATYDRRFAPLVLLSIFGTSIWAAIDSAKIDLQKYQTVIALHPVILFNLMYFFWFVLFPWYLVVRSQIRAGSLPRRKAR